MTESARMRDQTTSPHTLPQRTLSFFGSLVPARFWRSLTFWLIIFANVAFVLLYFWSRGGASTLIRIEATGTHFSAQVDGREVASGAFAAQDQGGIGIVLATQYRLPALPKPYGVDWVRVTDAKTGDILLEDNFDGEMSPLWQDERGNWTLKNGLLTTDARQAITTGPQPWSDIIFEAKFRNITEATVYFRMQDTKNSMSFGISPFRNHGGARLVLTEDGVSTKRVDTDRLEVGRGETIKSITAMVLRPYPYAVLIFAAVVILAFVVRVRRAEQLLHTVGRFIPEASTGIAIGLAAGTGVLLWYLLYALGDHMPHVPDSVAYVFQAKIFASFHVTAHAPPARESFSIFNPHMLQLVDGRWFTHYPFGHPLFLALGELTGKIWLVPAMPWLVPPVLGAASLAMLYGIGRRVYSAPVGLVAAILLAASPFFLMTASNFMSHNTAAFTIISALFLIVIPRRWRLPATFVAGVFVGLLFNIRPLTAVAFLPVLAVFFGFELLRASPGVERLLRQESPIGDPRLRNLLGFFATAIVLMAALYVGYNKLPWYFTALMAVPLLAVLAAVAYPIITEQTRRAQLLLEDLAFSAGAALLFGAYFLYNRLTTGSFGKSPYELQGTFTEGHFGFAGPHSLTLGIQNEQELLSLFLLVANGWPLIVGLIVAALPFLLGSRNKWDYLFGAAFLAIATAPMFYASSAIMYGPRFWYESLPFLILLSARGIDILASSASSTADWLASRFHKDPSTTSTGISSVATYGLVAGLVAFSLYGWLFAQRHAWGDNQIAVNVFTPQSAGELEGFNFTDDRLLQKADELGLHHALVFVDQCSQWWCYGSVFWTNSPSLNTDIVWAERQTTDDDLTVLDTFPNRDLYSANFARDTIEPTTADEVRALVEEEKAKNPNEPPPTVQTTPEERDATRRTDLEQIVTLLAQYAQANGAFPSTNGQFQSLCAYRTLDAGCILETIGPIPTEPLGEAIKNGYWFTSDGTTYTLAALRETNLDTPSNCPDGLYEPDIDRMRMCVLGSLP